MYLFVPLIEIVLSNTTDTLDWLGPLNPKNYFQGAALVCFLILLIFIVSLVKVFSSYVGQTNIASIGRDFQVRLRTRLFEKYLQFKKLYIDAKSIGHFYHIISDDSARIAGTLFRFHAATQALIALCVYFALMCWVSIKLTLLSLGIFPVLYFALRTVIVATKQVSREQSQKALHLAKMLQNVMGNISLIKAYASERYELDRVRSIVSDVGSYQLESDKKNLLIAPIQEIVLLIFLAVTILFLFFFYLQAGGSAASAAIFIVLLRRASLQLSALNTFWYSIADLSGPLHNVSSYLRVKDLEVADTPEAADMLFERDLVFDSVSFKYSNERQVLHSLSFSLPKGKTLALVGHTGAGKSTIAQLLMRFYSPHAGRILIDGKDINAISLSAWRRSIAYVSQDDLLFHDTLHANIVYGLNPQPDEVHVKQSLELAQLEKLVAQLPHGLQTIVGERGVQLSGGERQRVSLARAFLKGAEIVILDEATSALDTDTEKALEIAFQSFFLQKTVLRIAHRLSTIVSSDHVLVLADGEIVEQGSIEDLMNMRGAFYSLVRAQDDVLQAK